MVGRFEFTDEVRIGIRAGDEIIIHDVVLEGRAGVRGVAGGIVVFEIVDEDGVDLRERIAVMRVGEDVVEPGKILADGFGVRPASCGGFERSGVTRASS